MTKEVSFVSPLLFLEEKETTTSKQACHVHQLKPIQTKVLNPF